MTSTPTRYRSGLSPVGKLLLYVGLPLLILVLAAIAIVTLPGFRAASVDQTIEADARESVSVETRNAQLRFAPSDDEQVHVVMTGRYSGREPTITADDTGDRTSISGGCPSGWTIFTYCEVTITVTLPADRILQVQTTNGRVTAEDLDGELQLSTTNGAIEVSSTTGRIVLNTTNGAIRSADLESEFVTAETTNGAIELEFAEAPEQVDARSSNGSVTVRVPDGDESYFVTADTTNGTINTDDVPSDRTADRTITANTTNGSVTIERAG